MVQSNVALEERWAKIYMIDETFPITEGWSDELKESIWTMSSVPAFGRAYCVEHGTGVRNIILWLDDVNGPSGRYKYTKLIVSDKVQLLYGDRIKFNEYIDTLTPDEYKIMAEIHLL